LISSVWHGPLCELRILISDHRFHLRDHTLEVCGRLAIFLEESRPAQLYPPTMHGTSLRIPGQLAAPP
jgi:hypothetical protein